MTLRCKKLGEESLNSGSQVDLPKAKIIKERRWAAMNKPTCEDLGNMVSVWRKADDSWRHGAYITEVFHRKEDDTYWMANYCLSTDGETNELREGIADVSQVIPCERTIIDYKPVDE